MKRRPLIERRRAERIAARTRIAARVRTDLTDVQRAQDPLAQARSTLLEKARRALTALGVSFGAHAALIALGFSMPGMGLGDRDVMAQRVSVEIREPPPPAPPPRKESRVDPEPAAPVVPAPKKAIPKAPKPQATHPPDQLPMRVVGLSLESTSESGDGPAFAVGNTRAGATADRAIAPENVAPKAPEPAKTPGGPQNAVASRLPALGVKYTAPKRRHPGEAPYPEALKSQGIEADVTVMVSTDSTGKVVGAKIIKASPYPEFNEAARQAALEEEFEPASRDGVPIPYTLSYTYHFRLESP